MSKAVPLLQISARVYRDSQADPRNIDMDIRQRLKGGVVMSGFPVDAIALRGVV